MTERNEPVDRRHEEALTAALHQHARTVRPAGDGLVRIRSRVERRRRRVRLVAPMASVAAAAAAVTAIVASGIFASPGHQVPAQADAPTSHAAAPTTTTAPTRPAVLAKTSAPSSSPSSAVATVASTAPAATVAPTPSTSSSTTALVESGNQLVNAPVWPFADAAAATAWQQSSAQKTSEAWHLDAREVAKRFVITVEQGLGLAPSVLDGTAPVVHDDGTVTVDLTRTGPSGSPIALGTVTLARWGADNAAPLGVVSVSAPAKSQIPITLTAPTPFTAAAAPLPVTWTLTGGAEDDDYVGAWAAGVATPASHTHVSTGGGMTVQLPTVPSAGTGFVAVLDGTGTGNAFALTRLAVTPVRYGAAGGPVVAAAKTYVAVGSGLLSVYDAADLSFVHHLAGVEGFIGGVTGYGGWAYVTGPGTPSACAQTLVRVPLDGSSGPVTVATTDAGTIGPVAIGGPGGVVQAWVQTPCGGKLEAATIHWRNTATGASGQISSPSDPPVAETLAVSPDGRQISGYVRQGMQGNVATFDLASATTVDQASTPSGCVSDGSFSCAGVAYEPNGDLVVVRSAGTTLSVLRLHAGHTTPLFSVAASSQVAHVEVDPAGKQVLLSATGKAWIWRGPGAATALPSGITDASW